MGTVIDVSTVDAVLVAVLGAAAAVGGLLAAVVAGPGPGAGFAVAVVVLQLVTSPVILVRRRWPVGIGLVIAGSVAAQTVLALAAPRNLPETLLFGLWLAARRRRLHLLTERAERAEREQWWRAEQARTEERHRLAAPLLAEPAAPLLAELVEEAGRVGQAVRLTEEGDASTLSPVTGRTAYRIVQEALTNARRHAWSATVRVDVSYDPHRTRIVVHNDAPASRNRPLAEGGGTGLAGLGERIELIGGSLRAGPDGAGGFRLEAGLPTRVGR